MRNHCKQSCSVVLATILSIAAARIAHAQGPALFPVEDWRVGAGSYVVKTGDFNGDGKIDFITNNNGSANIAIRLGDGAGKFAAPAFFPTANFPVWLDVADVNNDGFADGVTCNSDSAGGIAAVLGNGAGGFGAPVLSAMTWNPRAIALGDFNNDGKADAIVITLTTNYVIATGNGLGGFASQTIAAPNAYYDVSLGDWNGDGNLDAAMASHTSNLISIFAGGGNGTLTIAQTLAGLQQVLYVTKGDLNGDGKTDLAASVTFTGTLATFLNNGSGTFTLHGSYAAGYDPRGIALGDLNHDQIPDAVVANASTNNAAVLLGDGAGGFGVVRLIQVGGGPITASIADADNDNNPDLFTCNASPGSVSVRAGNGAGTFAGSINFASNGPSAQALAADLNRDGHLDMIIISSTASQGVTARLGDGAGNFGNIITSPETGYGAIGDFNGDSFPDLVLAKSNPGKVSVRAGNGAGAFGGSLDLTVPLVSTAMLVDVDLDGKLDIVAGSPQLFSQYIYTFTGNGSGGFAGPIITSTSAPMNYLSSGDMNNDGIPDVVSADNTAISCLFGDGAGSFPTAVLNTTFGTGTASCVPSIADADFDGNLDAAIGAQTSLFPSAARAMRGFGNGTLASNVIFTVPSVAASVMFADVTGDGYDDLISAIPTSNNIFVWPSSGPLTFSDRRDFATGGYPDGMAIADWNEDGRLDVATANLTTNNFTLLTNLTAPPSGIFTYGTGTPGCTGASGIEANTSPNLNNSQFAILVTNTPRSSLGLLLITDVQDTPGSDIFGIGILIHAAIAGANDILLFDIVSDTSGYAALQTGIPNNPILLQRTFYAQSIWYDSHCNATPSNFNSSHALGITILP
ncbi:MAG: VCBS repeat-containing protein [Planctomycetes bacterium]|nr:VCBS repeat-containing protein [Planctomycetota bacterium]